VIGAVVPGWPTTIFCIIALYCFKRSSARLENWLLNHRVVGPTLRDWDENQWITLRTKRIAIGAMWSCMLVSGALIPNWTVRGIIVACGLGVTAYLATRRTKPAHSMNASHVVSEPIRDEIVKEPIPEVAQVR
jgi:uncharacterized membrane protein YbaN (DUF454 family)